MGDTDKKTGPEAAPVNTLPMAVTTADKGKDPAAEALDKAIEEIPYIGKLTVFILKKFGWAGILLYMGGVITATVLTYSGLTPEQLISGKYKGKTPNTDKAETGLRVTPKSPTFKVLENKPDWVQFALDKLRLEGAVKQNGLGSSGSSFRYSVESIELPIGEPSKSFTWQLSTVAIHIQISGRAYRFKTDGLLQPLEYIRAAEGDSISFTVPECNKGDRLIAVLSLTWEQEIGIKDHWQNLRSEVR